MVFKGKEGKHEGVFEGTKERFQQVVERMGGGSDENRHVGEIGVGTGDDRVRDPRRGTRRHSHPGNHGVPTSIAGALERNRRRHQQLVGRLAGESGQSTVEFAVVTAGFLALSVALSALWHVLSDGVLVEHALAVASHHIQAVAPVTIVDIFLY